MHLKKGPLSEEDKRNIQDWISFKTPEETARDLNRSPKQVAKYRDEYIANAPEVVVKKSEKDEFLRELHAGSNWLSLKEQFTDGELIFFENTYAGYRSQFKEMSPTEVTQLHQLITLELFMNRHNRDRRKIQEEIEIFEKLLRKERELSSAEIHIEKLQRMEDSLLACRSATGAKTKEYKDLLEKHEAILKNLKGTREQRMKNMQEAGKFISVLKELEVQSRRQTIGEVMGLVDLAVTKERERLAAPHQFMDGMIDQPLLVPELVEQED